MTNLNELCPICTEGHLTEQAGGNEVSYKGETRNIALHFSVCDSCGMEQGNAAQTLKNKREMLEFKRTIDGLLSGEEIREIRTHFGITQFDLAKVLGGGPVAFSKYEKGDVSQSASMDKLIRVCRKFPEAFDWLTKQAGVEYNKSKFLNIVSRPLELRNYFSPAKIQNNYSIEAKQNVLPNCANGNKNTEQAIQAA